MRRVHQLMVDAALTGDGFDRMAELAAEQIGRPVGIVVPELEVAVVWPGGHTEELAALRRLTEARIAATRAAIPQEVDLVVPISFADRLVGVVGMLAGAREVEPEASEFLHLAATSSAAAMALEEARERDSAQVPDGLFAGLRAGSLAPAAAARRAAAEGCDLAGGLVVSVTEVGAHRPREALSVVASEFPDAVAELVGERLYALLPARRGEPRRAEAVAERLRAYGSTGTSSHYGDPGELGRAVREAELVLEAMAEDSPAAHELAGAGGAGVYRLLFRALASDPEEVKRFYEDTVAPLVGHDEQYRGDLLPTLEAYLGHDCNMNATARAIYAHRHTVAYRLERVKELTGLDPAATEDRERLGLGLKALRMVDDRTA
jgi:sugar diacid utilization regulator